MYAKTLTLCISLFLIAPSSATVIYKWVDKDGVTHYSQQIPENTEHQSKSKKLYSEDIEPQLIGTVAPSVRTEENQQSQAQQDAAKINEHDKEQAKEICKNAEYNLNILETHSRLNRKDKETGEVTSITAEQRQERIKQQKQRIKLFCK